MKTILILLNAVIYTVASQLVQHETDIVCNKVTYETFDYVGKVKSCYVKSSKLSVINLNTRLRNVLYENPATVDSNATQKMCMIGAPNLHFLPTGLNKFFPELKVLEVHQSFLTHIDQLDMKQFGTNLQWISIQNTLLTYLEGDLFEFNSKLAYVDFEGNPLQYIGPQLFKSFIEMGTLKEIDFRTCECIDKEFKSKTGHKLDTFIWNMSCSDLSVLKSRDEIENIKTCKASTKKSSIDELKMKLPKIMRSWKALIRWLLKTFRGRWILS